MRRGLMTCLGPQAMREVPAEDIALDVLDLITIVVPPALPYAMAVGIIVGVERLSRLGIFCISPRSVNLAGLLDLVCFDKVSRRRITRLGWAFTRLGGTFTRLGGAFTRLGWAFTRLG